MHHRQLNGLDVFYCPECVRYYRDRDDRRTAEVVSKEEVTAVFLKYGDIEKLTCLECLLKGKGWNQISR